MKKIAKILFWSVLFVWMIFLQPQNVMAAEADEIIKELDFTDINAQTQDLPEKMDFEKMVNKLLDGNEIASQASARAACLLTRARIKPALMELVQETNQFIQIWNNGLHHYCFPLPKRSWKRPARNWTKR